MIAAGIIVGTLVVIGFLCWILVRSSRTRFRRAANNFYGVCGFEPPYKKQFVSDYGTRHNRVIFYDYIEGSADNQRHYLAKYGHRQPADVFIALWNGQPIEDIPETIRVK
jgi:hypothetical protein